MLDRHALKALMQAIGRGERTAFEQFYRDRAGPVYALTLRILGDPDLATEALQQTFVDIWRSATTGQSNWDMPDIECFRIARRHAIELSMRSVTPPMDVTTMEMRNPVADGTASFELLHVMQCIGKMSDECRNLFVQGFFDAPVRNGYADKVALDTGDFQALLRRCYAEYVSVSEVDNEVPDRNQDLLAMSQALGIARIPGEPVQAGFCQTWERRLAPLAELLEPVAPPEGAFEAISMRLNIEANTERVAESGRNAETWRAVLFVLIASVAAVLIYFGLLAISDDASAASFRQ